MTESVLVQEAEQAGEGAGGGGRYYYRMDWCDRDGTRIRGDIWITPGNNSNNAGGGMG